MDRDKEQKVKVHDDFAGEDVLITTETITSGSGIAIGRGARAVVLPKEAVKRAELVKTPELSFGELTAQIDESDLPQYLKGRMQSYLENLRFEVERGEAADVKNARQVLKEISGNMPELNQLLWGWLERTEHVSTAIKIVARKMLT
ncbi:MAG: hypothetical protein ACE5OS_13520 [Anaerolineae bacterium]